MIANARMYSVGPEAAKGWRALLSAVIEHSGLDIRLLDHTAPVPIEELWRRSDKAAVFMCGLPFSRALPRPRLIAAPVPSPAEFRGLPEYWSALVVRKDSAFNTLEDTFGGRIALTEPDSQSGCLAALFYLMAASTTHPLYGEVIAPRITPWGAMTAVVDGAADVAPIDSYAYCLLERYRPELTSQLRIVAQTAPTPIPVLVASSAGLDSLQDVFLEAHRIATIVPLLAELLLERFVCPEPDTYDALQSSYHAATRFWHAHTLATTVHPAFVF